MTAIKIDNIQSQLGSIRLTYKNLNKIYPEWNLRKVALKTGIETLFIANEKEDVLNLSLKSCYKTLRGFDKDLIDCIIVVTQTAKNKLPSVSCILQDKLKLKKNLIAFDIGLGCSGYIYALGTIKSLLSTNMASNVLLVCSDTYSKFTNENNRTCRTVFSDAASSCIIRKAKGKNNIVFSFLSDGSGANDLIEKDNNIEMMGSNIFQFTTYNIPQMFNKILKQNNIKKKEIKKFIFHQASKIVLSRLKDDLKIEDKKFATNYNKIGNTVSSSIPILIKELVKSEKIKKNDLIMLMGFGVGLSASACIIKWK